MAHLRTHSRYCAVLLASFLLSLGGCGGGGGGSPIAAASAPASTTQTPRTSGIAVNLQAPNTTVAFPAAAVTVFGATKGLGNVTISPAGQGATITLTTDTSGNLSGVEMDPNGISDKSIGISGTGRSLTDPYSGELDLPNILCCSNTIGYAITQIAVGQGLTSSAYGLWASTLGTPTGNMGAFAFGNLTPAASVPTTGSATFSGFTIGMGGAADGHSIFNLKGNAQIIANFATQSVTTNLTNISASTYGASTSVPDLTGTSSIAGNAYAGPISGGGLVGTINGNFYGSAAQETAGVWQASGGGNAWIGSYGAK